MQFPIYYSVLYQVSPHVCTPNQNVPFGQPSQGQPSQSPMISHSPLTQQSPVTVQDKNAFYFDSRQHDTKANVNEKNLEALFPSSGNLNLQYMGLSYTEYIQRIKNKDN